MQGDGENTEENMQEQVMKLWGDNRGRYEFIYACNLPHTRFYSIVIDNWTDRQMTRTAEAHNAERVNGDFYQEFVGWHEGKVRPPFGNKSIIDGMRDMSYATWELL
jgi:hypothetical protein